MSDDEKKRIAELEAENTALKGRLTNLACVIFDLDLRSNLKVFEGLSQILKDSHVPPLLLRVAEKPMFDYEQNFSDGTSATGTAIGKESLLDNMKVVAETDPRKQELILAGLAERDAKNVAMYDEKLTEMVVAAQELFAILPRELPKASYIADICTLILASMPTDHLERHYFEGKLAEQRALLT